MAAAADQHVGRWPFAILFVASLHLPTLPLTWLSTDLGEMVHMARRLVERRTLTLADDGTAPVPDVPWVPHRAGEPVRSRLHPGTSLVLAPLVLVDRALGYRDPMREGRAVYLQGLACVLAALVLLGLTLQACGAPEGATMAILFTGTSSPLWRASRNAGAEPLLALLLIAYAGAQQLAAARQTPRRFLAARALCLALMPVVHPTGLVLSPLLGAAELLGAERRAGLWLAGSGLAGSLGFTLAWNQAYHGHWLTGGYSQVGGMRVFDASPLLGGWTLVRDLAIEAPLALFLSAWIAARAGGRAAAAWRLPALALAAILVLYAMLYEREAVRRFAPAVPLLGLPLGLGWARLGWPPARAQLLVVASIAWGVQRLLAAFGAYYEGPDGLFYPAIFWVKRGLDSGLAVSWIAPPVAALLALGVSWRRVFPPASPRA